jgi:hypothetical protein
MIALALQGTKMEVNAMREMSASRVPYRFTDSLTQVAKYVLFGGAGGLVVALGVMFVLAFLYGESIGLSLGGCSLYAGTITMLLSQPAGVIGMIIGATTGALVCAGAYYVHHHLPRSA